MDKVEEIENFNYLISVDSLKRDIELRFNLYSSESDLKILCETLGLIEAKKLIVCKAICNSVFNRPTSAQIIKGYHVR